MRCAARRKSPGRTGRLMPPRSFRRTTSHRRNRTSKRPSAKRVTLPVSNTSAERSRQGAKSGRDVSSSSTPTTGTTWRNCPLRSKSALTMPARSTGAASAPLSGAMANGICVRPTPDTSTLNWAWAADSGNKTVAPTRERLESDIGMNGWNWTERWWCQPGWAVTH